MRVICHDDDGRAPARVAAMLIRKMLSLLMIRAHDA